MQQHIYYTKYALQFADMQIPELVNIFNSQVQNRGWSSMRAYHDQALIDEFQRRGIDVLAVYNGKTISFTRPIKCDIADNRLATIGWNSFYIKDSTLAVCSWHGWNFFRFILLLLLILGYFLPLLDKNRF